MITLTDPTLAGTKDPARRLQKLQERRLHIEDTITELQDKHYIIESEIAQAAGGGRDAHSV